MTNYPTYPQAERMNPFETHELVVLRWTQRRQIRCVPDHVVRQVLSRFAIRPAGSGSRQTLIEIEVRALVTAEADGLEEFLLQCEKLGAAEGLRSVFYYQDFEHPLDDLAHEAATAAQANRLSDIGHLINPIQRLLLLAFVADDLADDGYRDPRLPQDAVLVAHA
jgi:hypothetical protein